MNFIALCKNEFRVYNTAAPATPVTSLPSGAVSSEGYARATNGVTALITPEGDVALYDADFVLLTTVPRRQGVARAVKVSPLGSFVVVFERFNAKQPVDNVFVYSLAAPPTLSTSFTLKSIADRDCILWTSDERFVLRLPFMGTAVDVYPGRNLAAAPLFRLQGGQALAQMSLAPNDRYLAVVSIEQSGAASQPARILLFDLQRGGSGASAAFHSKPLPFGVDAASVNLSWSKSGFGLLITATTATGSDNYYGTTSLSFLRVSEASTVAVDERIAVAAQTSVWSETSDEFLALTGEFPCEVGLYDGRTGRMKMSFGKYRRNVLVFQSFSRYFLLLGLGNLPGDFELFDKNKGIVLASGRLMCPVQVLFAPDGRTWLAATTSPRMRVDNGFSLFNYDGSVIASKVAINDLYHLQFLPTVSPLPDVPPSPRVVAAARAPAASTGGPAVVGLAAESGAGAVPRFGRGGAFAEALRRAKQEEETAQVKKLPVSAAAAKEAVVPGLAACVLNAGKSRNERRRLGKAKAAFAEEDWEKPKGEVVKKANAVVEAPTISRGEEEDEEEEDKDLDPKKKLRNLNKKLKEIERLEEKKAEELNELQKQKINNKMKLLAEIALLNK